MKTQPVRSSLKHFIGVLMVAVLLLAGTPARPAAAVTTTRYVNGTTGIDADDCSSSSCLTIAYAMSQANDDDTIQIAAGTYARITVDKNLTFIGKGMNSTILDGGLTDRVVVINSGKVVAFKYLAIQHGSTAGSGGGIQNYGTLSLSHVKVADNTSTFGGGIFSSGVLTMTDSIINGNTANGAFGDGGGLALDGAGKVVTLNRVTISNNIALLYDGGIHDQMDNSGSGSLTLTNVTITGNTAQQDGAMAVTALAIVHVVNSTIAANHVTVAGMTGGVANYATISFKNTIIAGNDNANCNVAMSGISWTSLGHNLDSQHNCAFTAAGDLIDTDPLLGALADNGGPTKTMALGPGSPAIDAGTNTGCPALDQRSIPRPVGATCDIGAFELGYLISGSVGVTGAGATLSYTDGPDKTVTADGSGIYSLAVSYDWSGTVTPSLAGYVFTPINRSYTHVLADQTGQDYTAHKTYLLSVSKTGTGSGTLSSNPTGIDCGSTCSYSFVDNTVVTLTAAAATGSTFSGWSSSGCSSTGTCTVTMSAARSVTASFTLNTYLLSVSKTGNGSGTVTSAPTGIDCGSDCSETYNYNTSVTLTATAATGSTFTGWSGSSCSGTGTCIVTVMAAASVTATFTLNTYLLSVSKTGTGSGTVTSSPGGITCDATCSHSFNYNTSVTLTATAATSSTFTGWSGSGCSGTGTCTVIMDAAKSVTADFTQNIYRIYLPLVIR